MSCLIDYLEKISNTGEIVHIIYLGGSKPGVERAIIPIKCTTTELHAIDPQTHINKTFKLNKILQVTPINDDTIRNTELTHTNPPQLVPIPQLSTLYDYYTHFKPELEGLGWHVHYADNCLSVASFLKNGNPRKTPSVYISFIDRCIDIVYDFETNGFVTQINQPTGKERPWRVDSWRLESACSYKNLHKAITFFINETKSINPSEGTGKTTVR